MKYHIKVISDTSSSFINSSFTKTERGYEACYGAGPWENINDAFRMREYCNYDRCEYIVETKEE